MDIVFPETTGRLPKPRTRQLKLIHVVAVLYAFGGVSVLAGIVSRFIVGPLVEQLTYDRRVFAEDARRRIAELNAFISSRLSRIPPVEYAQFGLVDQQTDSIPESKASQEPAFPVATQTSEQWRTLESSVRKLEGKSYDSSAANLASEAEELQKFLRGLVFGDGPGSTRKQTAQLKEEIRSFKGALLSL